MNNTEQGMLTELPGMLDSKGKEKMVRSRKIGGKQKGGGENQDMSKKLKQDMNKIWSCKQSLPMIYQGDKAKDKTRVQKINGIISYIENTMGLFLWKICLEIYWEKHPSITSTLNSKHHGVTANRGGMTLRGNEWLGLHPHPSCDRMCFHNTSTV